MINYGIEKVKRPVKYWFRLLKKIVSWIVAIAFIAIFIYGMYLSRNTILRDALIGLAIILLVGWAFATITGGSDE